MALNLLEMAPVELRRAYCKEGISPSLALLGRGWQGDRPTCPHAPTPLHIKISLTIANTSSETSKKGIYMVDMWYKKEITPENICSNLKLLTVNKNI